MVFNKLDQLNVQLLLAHYIVRKLFQWNCASDCTVSVKLCTSCHDNASHEETNGIVLGLTTFLSLLNKPNYVALHPVSP